MMVNLQQYRHKYITLLTIFGYAKRKLMAFIDSVSAFLSRFSLVSFVGGISDDHHNKQATVIIATIIIN